jgi:hypothetical protein
MRYIERNLSFYDDRIVYYSDLDGEMEVMMDWEDELMKASADYICQRGGDILEIGFGMGISANYIQSHPIRSHTIVENHPEVIPRLNEWALDKPNVIVVSDGWYQSLQSLSTYDGVLYDTFGDEDNQFFGEVLPSLVKPSGLATWWNAINGRDNVWKLSGVTYDKYEINPPPNKYFNHTTYYLPKWQQQQ